ncbi:MAG: hypothetical protein QNL91_05940 [Candidatus Krumholzibacteria bacterium]|nr:hypothetical protein [Candidatus Krumholzibacteria bacterium]
MSQFYVTGGRQRKGAKGHEEWFSYAEALIMKVDTDTQKVVPVVSYESPAEHRPSELRSNIVFKAGTKVKDHLYVCTQTEVLTYSLPDFELIDCLSHPWFNDLHYVTVNAAGNFLVTVTGLDLIVEITPNGEIVRELPVLEEDVWKRFDRDTDYRRVLTTKPHHSHPNYLFEYDGEIFATRLEQRDVACVTDRSRFISPGIEKLHDGVIHDDKVYLTSVDSHVVVADPATGKVLQIHDLSEMSKTNKTLGWCRGIYVLGDNKVLIGFSRVRPSKIRENLRWVKHQVRLRGDAGMLGTRIGCYDLARGVHEWDIDLEPFQMNAVFSILPAYE